MKILVEEANGLSSAGEGRGHREIDVTEKPMPTVQEGRPVRIRMDYRITDDGRRAQPEDKPPYLVPSMAEVRGTPWNGLAVASFFAGCGGSSLGYRMAGYRVGYACDVDPAARASYEPNMADGSVLDGRSIRDVRGAEVLEACGVAELDVLDGSPPCVSFSTAGRRHKLWGKQRAHAGTVQRQDDLFMEWLRVVGEARPRAFVAENVSGLLKGVCKGYFLEVLAEAKRHGYRVRAKLLDAQWLGVPQARQRVIFVGLRDDAFPAGVEPPFPRPLPYRYSLRDACPWIIKARWDSMGQFGSMEFSDGPMRTVEAGGGGSNQRYFVERESDISRYEIGKEWDRLRPGEQSGRYHQLVRAHPDRPVGTITAEGGNPSLAGVTHPTERRKFTIAELKRVCAFPDDFELRGSYSEQWARLGNSVPPLMMRAVASALAPVLLAAREGAEEV